jgi:hypothetical protein
MLFRDTVAVYCENHTEHNRYTSKLDIRIESLYTELYREGVSWRFIAWKNKDGINSAKLKTPPSKAGEQRFPFRRCSQASPPSPFF